jgi:hypothetical protein
VKTLKIWQIYYKLDQAPCLDDSFVPFDNSSFKDEALEFAVFERLFDAEESRDADFWGALSWRFHEKTGLTGKLLRDHIGRSSGVDVFYTNPFPYIEALFQSPWVHGEVVHPKFLSLSEAFLVAAELPTLDLTRLTSSVDYSNCNYFIGNYAFWSSYIPFVKESLKKANKNLCIKMKERLHSTDADSAGVHNSATYVPFIIERLFGVFMATAGRTLTVSKFKSIKGEMKMNLELLRLRELKDVAVMTKSKNLMDLWIRERNNYCKKTYGSKWYDEYLPILNNIRS